MAKDRKVEWGAAAAGAAAARPADRRGEPPEWQLPGGGEPTPAPDAGKAPDSLSATDNPAPPPLPLSPLPRNILVPKGQATAPRTPPALPTAPSPPAAAGPLKHAAPEPAPAPDATDTAADDISDATDTTEPPRRSAKRRPAAPSRGAIAANDDAPSIGGLIYALQQKPSKQPFTYAAIGSGVWLVIGALLAWAMLAPEFARIDSFVEIFARPALVIVLATILAPIALFWVIATLIWRAQELRLMSSAMTEVAVRLAEPDRTAEQAIASLGQAVRRQVGHMNDAVSMALGRAGELESLVHSEVASLERSYAENERRIRGLLGELQGERAALETTSDSVSNTLRAMGGEIPELIEKLSSQQLKLSKIVEGAGQNLIALESKLTSASDGLEASLGSRTTHLESVLNDYTAAINSSLGTRTTELQAVFEEYTRALDTTLANRAQAIDTQLVDRTRALDDAFTARLQLFDDSIVRSTLAIDSTVGQKALALTNAMEGHAQALSDTLQRQSVNLDESLMNGINAVRRTSENITRQSMKAIEGLSGQSDMLKNVSENLLQQIGGVTGRFENQGQSILRAANALESANYRIDQTLANRHRELNETLVRLSGKTEDLDRVMQGYSTNLEGSLSEAEQRARAFTEQMASAAQQQSRHALAGLEQLKSETEQRAARALEDMRGQIGSVGREVDSHLGGLTNRLNQTTDALRGQFGSVNREVDAHLGGLTSRLSQTTEDLRQNSARATAEFEAEQARIQAEATRLPAVTRESSEGMRRVLQEQLAALEQLSSLSTRSTQTRDVQPPVPLPPAPTQAPVLADAYAQQRPPVAYAPPVPPRPTQALPPVAIQPRGPWSVGDLLARASHGDPHAAQPAPVVQAAGAQGGLNIESIARALDPATASAIWARVRSGQRGFMVRSIYPADARSIFDEVQGRYRMNGEFRATVDHFLADFDRLLAETERRDASGHAVNSHLLSDSGRVYLFLAHASGRLG